MLSRRDGYSRAEYVSDLAVHLIGVVSVAACVPALVVVSVFVSDTKTPVFGALVYGVCFAAMIGCSALYNIVRSPEWDWLLRRLDHSAIYLKIAGTVTGLAMIAGHGWILVSFLWSAAGIGIALKLLAPFRFHAIGVALYLAMGWSAALLGGDIFELLPNSVVWLITSAGLTYTFGVGFYLWDRLPFHFTIWHVCVLAGSLQLYAAIVLAVLAR